MKRDWGINVKDKNVQATLSIVGAFLTVILSVNAFFVKEMLESLNQVKIQTAVLIDRSDVTRQDLAELKKRVLRLEGI